MPRGADPGHRLHRVRIDREGEGGLILRIVHPGEARAVDERFEVAAAGDTLDRRKDGDRHQLLRHLARAVAVGAAARQNRQPERPLPGPGEVVRSRLARGVGGARAAGARLGEDAGVPVPERAVDLVGRRRGGSEMPPAPGPGDPASTRSWPRAEPRCARRWWSRSPWGRRWSGPRATRPRDGSPPRGGPPQGCGTRRRRPGCRPARGYGSGRRGRSPATRGGPRRSGGRR